MTRFAIPVCEPTLLGNERTYVLECLETNQLAQGRFVEALEEAFARYCGVKYGVACCNGTSALHLALLALGIGQGHEVVVPSFTMIASAGVVVYTGARPVFAEADPVTWTVDPADVARKITPRTRAVIAVAIYGNPCDMDGLQAAIGGRDIALVEDAAEGLGAEYRDKKVGSLGQIAAFSLYSNKAVTCGEGGMVVTDSAPLADRCRLLRNHAFGEPRFYHRETGHNFRLTQIQAAIGLAQMERVEELVEARRRNASAYCRALHAVPGLTLPAEPFYCRSSFWMFGLLVNEKAFGMSRDALMASLLAKGVETRPFFYPLHRQPAMGLSQRPEGSLPIAERLGREGLYLPSSSSLTSEQLATVVRAVKECHEEAVVSQGSVA